MKIAISSTGDTLNSEVDSRFGRAEQFIIYDTDDGSFTTLSNPSVDFAHGAGIQTAQSIINTGVQVVITGNVGPNAFRTLSSAGIKIYTGATGTVWESINAYKQGKLQLTENPTTGGHSGMR